jgi:hypothetical protein
MATEYLVCTKALGKVFCVLSNTGKVLQTDIDNSILQTKKLKLRKDKYTFFTKVPQLLSSSVGNSNL